ncbi:hypothetical protein SAMN05443144_101178 [Fodinibius roseus]|uniref:DUF5777 domain-containing protein n=1 Tax=Fodinibius roseus TaxID=1194090 RepID=A0A1M4T0X8_9BACT|nr:DUF5777 family beta-barrel protein [Fodinibius roseus]SHE38118.1 hypothetical protein SAMN05443144_101178 [Fodinibius roseus]
MHIAKTSILIILLHLITVSAVLAQMERERSVVNPKVDAFWTPTLITQATTHHLAARNLNVTIMHSFGIATSNVVRDFFGFDNVQNVRLGLDLGLTDRWSVGVGRSSQLNVVDIRTKYALFQQDKSDKTPVSISLKGDLGIVTQENRRPLEDDISTQASVVISRKFNDTFSLQVNPMYAHFNYLNTTGTYDLFSLGIGSSVQLSNRFALTAEYYPVVGDRVEGTNNAFSLGLNIQTGGHVFQLFFTSSEWHLEQYVLANNDNQFWAGDFRFGFNVNRIFGL